MEKLTSEIFKLWQQTAFACQSVKHGVVEKGTAEDRVTAVNDELARTSLTRGVSLFFANGNVVTDLKPFLLHLKAIKASLDHGMYLDKRNKYGVDSFILFAEWLLKYPHLDTDVKIRNFLINGKGLNQKNSVKVMHACSNRMEEVLDKMGASWFVSYAYNKHIDHKQNSWKNVSAKSLRSRSCKYKSSAKMHRALLLLVLKMDDAKLETNCIGLTAADVHRMARKLLKTI